MTRKFEWHLRRRLAERDIFKTTDLVPLLAEQGVSLSREQVYRLVTSPPQRLNMEVLDALCLILGCTPNDLITFEDVTVKQTRVVGGTVTELGALRTVPAKLVRPDKQ
ncbi:MULTISPECIES: helix-turn-helix domain-containing protein [Microbacterium]|uniref:Helix-turn-helix transcriptional regulator n=1 Tax=Microbacterium memoriense TaxID=2978350 RepID=A0ABT2PEQ5_9MICO|nr:helix-turn-helix transcriptional regulator [Microbacterium memoriense]MCT9002950.1 helix-turn-helix transcriptional regulator [Microbacterium memoriense]